MNSIDTAQATKAGIENEMVAGGVDNPSGNPGMWDHYRQTLRENSLMRKIITVLLVYGCVRSVLSDVAGSLAPHVFDRASYRIGINVCTVMAYGYVIWAIGKMFPNRIDEPNRHGCRRDP